MAVTIITKSRVGFSAAILATAAIGWSVVLTRTSISVRNEAIVCGALALVGLISWIKGGFSETRPAEPLAKGKVQQGGVQLRAKEAPEVNPLAFLGQGKYWGVILVVSAGMLSSMCLFVHRESVWPTVLRLAKAPVGEAKPGVVTFPSLKLQGVVSNGIKSSAVINGNNLFLGELISGVRLMAVGLEEVTVELAGQTKVLVLPPVNRQARGCLETPVAKFPPAVPTK